MAVTKAIDDAVRTRAQHRCEYCLLPQSASKLKFWIDHVIASQHAGAGTSENLALACPFCNRHKGPNLAGIDPVSGSTIQLFNPRSDIWDQHFQTDREQIIGISPVGRATVFVLAMNHPVQTIARAALLREGYWPRERGPR
jgi:hypothetical protein